MKRTKCTYLALLAVALSPMAVNADLISVSSTLQEGDVNGDFILDDLEFGAFLGFIDAVIDGGASGFDLRVDWVNLDLNGSNETITVELSSDGDLVPLFSGLLPLTFTTADPVNSAGFGSLSFDTNDFLGLPTDSFIVALFFTDFSGVGSADNPCCDGSLTVSLSYETVSVPEPSTIALLSIGLAGMGLSRRRKKI